ncbi:MAG: SDR family NAD(P)-dependent oxidoreductase [Myxococcota bacterium]
MAEYRTAFVTGASSGIGAELCKRMAGEGIEVGLAARRRDQLESLAEEIRAAGGRARVYPLDVGDGEQTVQTVQKADDEMGGLDLVVANAGVGKEGWLGKATWAGCKPTIDVNVSGAVATLVAIAPRMAERKRGHLVGVSSLAQYRGLPRNGLYSATKAFLANFLEGLRIDLRGVNVAVTDARPGFVRTPMTAKNEFPMPFLLDVDDAVDIMWKGIRKKDAVVAFPWQLATVMRTTTAIPSSIWDRAMTRARG